MTKAAISADETLTALNIGGLEVLQKKQGFRFSIDAVLLARFAHLKNGWHVGDLGCGCGIIAFLLAGRCPGLAIDGVEIQPKLAEMAKRSVALNQIEYIHIYQADLRTLPDAWRDSYDLIVCNPPYFPANSGKISPIPQVAQARHELTCTLKDVLMASAKLLKSGGHLAMVYRPNRLRELLEQCTYHHLTPRRLRFVHPDRKSPANLILLEAVKGAKEDLRIEAPLLIYESAGQYSPEVAQYFEEVEGNG